MSDEGLLVVAGEPSGDRIAASVLHALGPLSDESFGIGGPACRRAGMRTLGDVSAIAAMGVGDVIARLPALAAAAMDLWRRIAASPPRAALLVNFTELNARLGRLLRRRGVRVLWAVAPQVWAWRAGRIRSLRGAVDTLAVLLPFEEPLWRDAGYDARFVGHPSLDVPRTPASQARRMLGLPSAGRAVAVLAGSRSGEVIRLGPPLCEAAALLRSRGIVAEARALAAPWLDARARGLLERAAQSHGIAVDEADPEHGAAPLLGAFDLALCASGTASLETALAGLPTVIAYRVDRLAYAVARRLVRTPHIGLPNVLLGRRAYPELLQDEATGPSIASAAIPLVGDEARARAAENAATLRAALLPRAPGTFGERVAELLRPMLV
ncbi:lipid-A-disaccharide synthase [Polyangium aurulentum]|uniref:lipid-A-disaccharide synthase n=1 Tax=Polyangium aurulentum TaxID=2567896 RepID=UPI001469F863|nr:lipid-A-disaccharide synthase [Polyangium aurulentum]UQA58216.1 lipid-A-disaccharide synthase [Polyangium aurulentum]